MPKINKKRIFVLSKNKNIIKDYPQYLNDDIYYFDEDQDIVKLVSFDPDYIIMPNKEVINVKEEV